MQTPINKSHTNSLFHPHSQSRSNPHFPLFYSHSPFPLSLPELALALALTGDALEAHGVVVAPHAVVHLGVGLVMADGRLQALGARALQVALTPAVESQGRGEGLVGGRGRGREGRVRGRLPHGRRGRGRLHELRRVRVVGQHVCVGVGRVHGGREEVLAALLAVPARAARREHG